ncbi:MAG: Hsp20/alpha crystallin family protein [Ignavibacteriales bacterium]|nr:Hsp20/alpha crystallin family protein [Ignavibacteriales bacterium]
MTLIRWNPLRDVSAWHPVSFENMQREIDRVFNNFRSDILGVEGSKTLMPVVDIIERENEYNIKVELPGVEKKDVKITVQDDVLTIKGEKRQENERKGDNYHHVERSYGIFQRSFPLPTSVQGEKIDASFENGVLSLTIPKLEEAKPKEIEVKLK